MKNVLWTLSNHIHIEINEKGKKMRETINVTNGCVAIRDIKENDRCPIDFH